jgi:DNA-binding response OmpR family regulator
MKLKLQTLEDQLVSRGSSTELRTAIHNSKICIIDDFIDDLKSLTAGLKIEGFTNIIELDQVKSVNELVESEYDLIILDLAGVAPEVCTDDGFGVLAQIKDLKPSLPVLVVTGNSAPPNLVQTLSKADLVLAKPVLSADLAHDAESLLRLRKDPFWTGLAILKELHRIDSDLSSNLGHISRWRLYFQRQSLAKKIYANDRSLTKQITTIADLLVDWGPLAVKILLLAKGIKVL